MSDDGNAFPHVGEIGKRTIADYRARLEMVARERDWWREKAILAQVESNRLGADALCTIGAITTPHCSMRSHIAGVILRALMWLVRRALYDKNRTHPGRVTEKELP